MTASNPFQQLPRGTRLDKISAGQIAAWSKSAQRDRERGEPTIFGAGDDATTSTYIRMQNNTGGALARFAVVRLSDALIFFDANPDEFWNLPSAKGEAPATPSAKDVIAVLSEPLADQAIGRAVVLGITPVKIQVESGQTGWKWADVTSGQTAHLVMKENGGPARIIRKESGTGEKWALVCLLGSGGEGTSGLDECAFGDLAGFDPDSAIDAILRVNSDGCVYLEYPTQCTTPRVIDGGTV